MIKQAVPVHGQILLLVCTIKLPKKVLIKQMVIKVCLITAALIKQLKIICPYENWIAR
jgi:hypothetical protein